MQSAAQHATSNPEFCQHVVTGRHELRLACSYRACLHIAAYCYTEHAITVLSVGPLWRHTVASIASVG